MTLPCVFHDIFIAVADTLAEAIEGEVGWVLRILRMFESNLRRVFLKFERFSSLRNNTGPLAVGGHAQFRHAKPCIGPDVSCVPDVRLLPLCRPHSATACSPFGMKANASPWYLPISLPPKQRRRVPLAFV